MKATAAVVWEKERPFSMEEVEVDEPRAGEVLVRIVGVGVCHTDLIVRDQWYPVPLPAVLGHEGSGVVERVGPGVEKVGPGGAGARGAGPGPPPRGVRRRRAGRPRR